MSLGEFSKTAKDLSRNPLGIIGLFLVLVYGVAGLVTTSTNLETIHKTIMIIFLVAFPVIVLIVFYKLVTNHHNKLYSPADFDNEENFMKAIDIGLKKSEKLNDIETLTLKIQKEIREQPLYKYTRLAEEGKVLMLMLHSNKLNLDEFSKEREFNRDKLYSQALILEQYEWVKIENNNVLEITEKGIMELETFLDLVYGRFA